MPEISTNRLKTPRNTDTSGVVDGDALRSALGQFATGVCIVSCRGTQDHAEPFAITVNSFASVSLDPPLILWCIQKQSITYDWWLQTSQFGISVLNATQADLCARYAIRGNHQMREPGDYQLSAAGNPLITQAVATFDCTTHAHHDAGDHTIIVGRVDALAHDNSLAPLVYLRGDVHASP